MMHKSALAVILIAALLVQAGCQTVPANSNQASGTSSSNSTSGGGLVLGALVAIGSIFLLGDDDDDCECKEKNTGIRISFD